jgi:hypothetical protein
VRPRHRHNWRSLVGLLSVVVFARHSKDRALRPERTPFKVSWWGLIFPLGERGGPQAQGQRGEQRARRGLAVTQP